MPNVQPPNASPQPPVPSSHALILASNSPRRRELLAEAGYRFIVVPPHEDVECGVCSESGPAGLVAELAYRKAQAVYERLRQEPGDLGLQNSDGGSSADLTQPSAIAHWQSPIVLAADTVAECDGFILGKPRDEEAAREMLRQLSGREHRVLTGVCLWPTSLPLPLGERLSASLPLPPGESRGEGLPLIRVAVTKLQMDPLSDSQLEEYLASGQWEGKAGAFGYQDRLGWVHVIEGSESNVVGLPMEMLAEMLQQLDEQRSHGVGIIFRGGR